MEWVLVVYLCKVVCTHEATTVRFDTQRQCEQYKERTDIKFGENVLKKLCWSSDLADKLLRYKK